jgi:hypothetical protein
MFNEVLMFEGQPVRVWSEQRDGKYLIWADGLMRWFHNSEIAKMKPAAKAAAAKAFPVQDVAK